MTLFKVWVTLYTCAASRAVVILDLTPHLDSHSFINKVFEGSLLDVVVQSKVISDVARNFVSDETQTFVHSFGADWRMNLPLALWRSGFFERLVRIIKVLSRKVLQGCRLDFEEM